MAENRERIEALGKAAYGLDDFEQIIEKMKSDPENRFGDKQELLEFSKNAVKRAHDAMPVWFGHLPARDAEVEPYPGN